MQVYLVQNVKLSFFLKHIVNGNPQNKVKYRKLLQKILSFFKQKRKTGGFQYNLAAMCRLANMPMKGL